MSAYLKTLKEELNRDIKKEIALQESIIASDVSKNIKKIGAVLATLGIAALTKRFSDVRSWNKLAKLDINTVYKQYGASKTIAVLKHKIFLYTSTQVDKFYNKFDYYYEDKIELARYHANEEVVIIQSELHATSACLKSLSLLVTKAENDKDKAIFQKTIIFTFLS